MRIGIVASGWAFMEQIIRHLRERHIVEVCKVCNDIEILRGLADRNDVVFSEWIDIHTILLTQLPKTCRIVVRGHSGDLFGPKVLQVDWNKVDKLILIEGYLRERLRISCDPQCEQQIIRLGIDMERFHPVGVPITRRIGFVGHIKPWKDPIPLLHLIENLGAGWFLRYKAVPTVFPDMDEQIRQVVSFLPNVSWEPEWIPNKDMPAFYQDVSILVNNSTREGCPVSVLEAMACGCYVLIRDWPGADTLYPGIWRFHALDECFDKIQQWDSFSLASKEHISKSMRRFILDRYSGSRYVNEMRRAITGEC